jgi:hypothetical protein
MQNIGGKQIVGKATKIRKKKTTSKRHFTVVIGNKEHGLYVSSSPSSAARKAVSKLCATDKKRKVEFKIREITQGSKKKTYGPYLGAIEKLKEPIELKGRVIRYKPVAKLNKKNRKMKGGNILGIGQEGIVLHPNINNKKTNQVSKLIQISDEKIDELIEFETKLNDIDPEGQFHVKMIPGKFSKLSQNFNNINSINSRNKTEFKKVMNKREKNGNSIIKPNFKITYEYGGISIEHFLENYRNYEEMIDQTFCKNILLGIANIFEGLHRFHIKGIHHLDLHSGNIVFLLDNPANMRIIDWGNLLEPLGGHPYVESLFSFNNECIIRLIEILKTFDTKLDVVKLDEFLKIHVLLIFKTRNGTNETLRTNSKKITDLPKIIIKFVEDFDI